MVLLACSQCGRNLPADVRFCPQCGHPRPIITEPVAASPATPALATAPSVPAPSAVAPTSGGEFIPPSNWAQSTSVTVSTTPKSASSTPATVAPQQATRRPHWPVVVLCCISLTVSIVAFTRSPARPGISLAQFAETVSSEASPALIDRNPERYTGVNVAFTGVVLQTGEAWGERWMFVSGSPYNGWARPWLYVTYREYTHLMEGDLIDVYGTVLGSFTYEGENGHSYTVPHIELKFFR